jgi:hypothetical protein
MKTPVRHSRRHKIDNRSPAKNDGCKLAAPKRYILPKATDFINR